MINIVKKEQYKKMVETRKMRGNYKHNDESKKKISDSHKGEKSFWFGKKKSIDIIKKGVDTRIKNGSYKVKEETKIKLRDNNAKYWLGKRRSLETINKISNKMKYLYNNGLKRKTPMEVIPYKSKEKMRLTKLNNPTRYWLNKKRSNETKLKISKAHKGKIFSEETKAKIRINALINHNYGMKGKHHSKESINKIKQARLKQILPLKDTKIEVKIQNFLKELGIFFFTHQYLKEIEHSYQCDILIPSMNLVIECDGDYFHKFPIGKYIDHIRTEELILKGFKILRLWECEIKHIGIRQFEKRLIEVNSNGKVL